MIDINEFTQKIIAERSEIIERYVEAWLAVNISDKQLTPKVFQDLELVEDRTNPLKTTWYLRFKNEHQKI